MPNSIHYTTSSVPVSRRPALTASIILATGLAWGAAAFADTTPPSDKLVPFLSFVNGLSNARAASFIGKPGMAVQDEAAFEEIQEHLLRVYGGQNVQVSFLDGGLTFDCIPLAEQPAKRLRGITSDATPPPFSPQVAFGKQTNGGLGPSVEAEIVKLPCPNGTFAMPRVTLEQISAFGSLRAFFDKIPNGAGQEHVPGSDLAKPSINGHAYSYTEQHVNNWGGQSSQSLNTPWVDGTLGEIFSLMQNWYVGGSDNLTQTVEVGWQNFPTMYGDENPRLFAYWTPDNYQTGCYNYVCGAFVAYSGAPISLGQRWTTYSVPGGIQYDITIGYYFYQGNWWLSYGSGWIGYYPGSLFGGGQLSKNATLIQFGTESASSLAVQWAPRWAAEGSGYFASAGWPYSGYQRAVSYRSSTGALNSPSLTTGPLVSPPSCYTNSVPTYGGSIWQTYFFLGGPGGNGC